MADLYGDGQPAGSPEEISSFLNHLLQSNSSSSKFPHSAAATSDRCYEYGFSEGEYPEGCFEKEKFEYAGTSAGSKRRGGVSSENELGDFSYDSEGPEASEVPMNTARQRSSSKRSRTAEIHNLSEKRRRSKINEKMKALQKLIPNSNKTDKASMLDEAIEYLKQLQLQVQMLTMRNGLSLHPIYLPGGIQPMQLPITGFNFEEGNGLLINNRVSGLFLHNEENSAQTSIDLPNQYNVSNEAILIPTVPNSMPDGSSFDLESLFPVHYGPLTISTTSKEICREGTSQSQLDVDQSMKASSSRVS